MAIVAAEIAIVVLAFTKKGEVEGFIDKRLEETLQKSKSNHEFYGAWDILQRDVNRIENTFSVKAQFSESE